jgi:hypothetical protein
LQSLVPTMLQVAALGGDNEQQMIALANAFASDQISADQFRTVLEALLSSHARAAQAATHQTNETAKLAGLWTNAQGPALGYAAALNAIASAQGLAASTRPQLNKGAGPGQGGAGNVFDAIGGGAASSLRPVIQANERLRDSEVQLRLARANSSAERVAVYRSEIARTTDQAEKNRLLAQIEGEKGKATRATTGAATAHTAELNKQLNLSERTFDSINKQRQATLDLRAAEIRDRQQRRQEETELKTADRVLANIAGNNPRAADFRARAQDARDLILIGQEQRQLDLEEKRSTAGGAIVNGRIFQSQAGISAPGASGGGAPIGIPAGAPAGSPAGETAITLQLVDSAGAVIAKTVEPILMDALMNGIRKVKLTTGV